MSDVPHLVSLFYEHLSPEARQRTPPPAEDVAVSALVALVAAAKREWPQLTIAPEEYVPFLAERAVGMDAASLQALRGGDLYLCCGCALGDVQALHAFEARMIPVARRAIERVGTSPEVCDDVLQQLRLRLFVPDGDGRPRIHSYTGRAALQNWLRVTVVRIMLNLKESEWRYVPMATADSLLESLPAAADNEFLFLKSAYREPCRAALREAVDALPPMERTLLSLHFIDGLNLERIAALHHISRATAARWLAHARESLLRETQRRVAQQLGLSPTEALSLLRDMQSQLLSSLLPLLVQSGGSGSTGS